MDVKWKDSCYFTIIFWQVYPVRIPHKEHDRALLKRKYEVFSSKYDKMMSKYNYEINHSAKHQYVYSSVQNFWVFSFSIFMTGQL